MIHPSAIIHQSAEISNDVRIAPYAVIGEKVRIGEGCVIGPHVVIEGETTIGEGCRVYPNAVLGTPPQDNKYRGGPTRLEIGPGCIFRECVTVNRGSEDGGSVTRIGKDCMFMAYSHVAHDCSLGDKVVMANSVALAGHVSIGSGAQLGGLAGVHQFARIGELAFIGAGAMVRRDVPPFMVAQGDRARISKINRIGLERSGMDAKDIDDVQHCFDLLKSAGLKAGLSALQNTEVKSETIQVLLDFFIESKLGCSAFSG